MNACTIKDHYPLPNIQDIFDSLGGKTVYSLIDMKSASFGCTRGQFEFLNGAYGLCNMPSIFQRTMEKALSPMLGKVNEPSSINIFVDDILLSSINMENHLKDLQRVFDLLRKANLKLKASKCRQGQRRIRLLRYVVTPEGIPSDPEKVDAIRRVAVPGTAKQVRSFLGMVNLYSKLITGYGVIVELLLHLTRQNVHYV